MKKLMTLLAVGALMLSMAAYATTARVATIDGSAGFVSDEVDAATFPHLLPVYADRVVLDFNGASGNLNLTLGPGVLGVYVNKGVATSGVFAAGNYNNIPAPGNNIDTLPALNLNNNATTATGSEVENVAVPQDRIDLAYGMGLGEALSLGLGLQWASSGSSYAETAKGLNGDDTFLSVTPDILTGVAKFTKTNSSSAIIIKPSLGLKMESLSVDLGLMIGMNSINNVYAATERDTILNPTNEVEMTQTIKDKGNLSLGVDGRVSVGVAENTKLVVRGNFSSVGQVVEGSGKIAKKTGMTGMEDQDFVLGNTGYNASNWGVGVALGSMIDKTKTLLTGGIGIMSSAVKQTVNRNQEKNTLTIGAGGKIDMVKMSEVIDTTSTFVVPVLVGLEQEIASWGKGRLSVTKPILRSQSVDKASTAWLANGDKASESTSKLASDLSTAATINVGLGIMLGTIEWDTVINQALLGGGMGGGYIANPSASSSLTYKW